MPRGPVINYPLDRLRRETAQAIIEIAWERYIGHGLADRSPGPDPLIGRCFEPKEVIQALDDEGIEYSESSVRDEIRTLTEEGFLEHPSHGLYELSQHFFELACLDVVLRHIQGTPWAKVQTLLEWQPEENEGPPSPVPAVTYFPSDNAESSTAIETEPVGKAVQRARQHIEKALQEESAGDNPPRLDIVLSFGAKPTFKIEGIQDRQES